MKFKSFSDVDFIFYRDTVIFKNSRLRKEGRWAALCRIPSVRKTLNPLSTITSEGEDNNANRHPGEISFD